jgi:hypothetical protein
MCHADKYHTSEVSAKDFRHVVLSSGLPLSAVEVALVSRQFTHGVGTVDYNRFMKFVSTGIDATLTHSTVSSPARDPKPSEFIVPATDSSASLLQRLLDAKRPTICGCFRAERVEPVEHKPASVHAIVVVIHITTAPVVQ